MSELLMAIGELFVKQGIPGAVAVVFAVIAWLMWKDLKKTQKEFLDALKESQTARINDSFAVRDKLLDVIKSCTEALTTATQAMEAQKEATESLEKQFTEILQESRRKGQR